MNNHQKTCQKQRALTQQAVQIPLAVLPTAQSQPAIQEFICDQMYCAKSFPTKMGLTQHTRLMHFAVYNDALPDPTANRQVWTTQDLEKLARLRANLVPGIGPTDQARLLYPSFPGKSAEQIRAVMYTKQFRDITLDPDPTTPAIDRLEPIRPLPDQTAHSQSENTRRVDPGASTLRQVRVETVERRREESPQCPTAQSQAGSTCRVDPGASLSRIEQLALPAAIPAREPVRELVVDFGLVNSPTIVDKDPATVIRELLQELITIDHAHPLIAAANRYTRRALESNDTNTGFDEFIDAIFPPKVDFEPKLLPPTRPPPTNNHQRRIAEYKRCSRLFKKNPKRLVNQLIDGAPVTYTLPLRADVERVYLERFSVSRPDETPAEPTKQCADPDGQVSPIDIDEIRREIKTTRRNTASGPDGQVNAKRLRLIPLAVFHRIFNLWLLMQSVPQSIKPCRTTLIPKTADNLDDVNNWRPITIGSILNRLYAKVLDQRIKPDMHWTQKGFMPVDGCGEHISVLTALINQSRKNKTPLCLVFLDLAKAFDTVPHDAIRRALIRHSVHPMMAAVISDLYDNAATLIACREGNTREIPIKRGVKQGCPLSPKLFNMVMDELLSSLPDQYGVEFAGEKICNLAFADDIVLISPSVPNMARMLGLVNTFGEAHGLQLNPRKCQALRLAPVEKNKKIKIMSDTIPQWSVNNVDIPMIKADGIVKYLGAHLSPRGSMRLQVSEITDWLEKVSKARLKPQQKLILLRSYLLPRLIYRLTVSSETSSNKAHELDRKVRKTVRKFLHLPSNLHLSFFHLPVTMGGLGIPALVDVVPLQKMKFINRNIASASDATRAAIAHEFWEKQKRKIMRWLHIPLWLNQKEVKTHRLSQHHERLAALINSTQGYGYEQIGTNPHKNDWLHGYKYLRPDDFINACKLMSCTLPTRVNLYRGQPNANKQCRRCHQKPETQNHVLATCPPMARAITARHNWVCGQLAKELRANDYQVIEEPLIQIPSGDRLKPDLVVVKDNHIDIVDVQIPYENRTDNVSTSYEYKMHKYEPLLETAKLKYGAQSARVRPVIIGARGTWCARQDSTFLSWSMTSKFRRKLSLGALIGTLRVWKLFLSGLDTRPRYTNIEKVI